MEWPCSIITNTIWIILRIEKVFCNRFAHPWILLQLVFKMVIWTINADWSTRENIKTSSSCQSHFQRRMPSIFEWEKASHRDRSIGFNMLSDCLFRSYIEISDRFQNYEEQVYLMFLQIDIFAQVKTEKVAEITKKWIQKILLYVEPNMEYNIEKKLCSPYSKYTGIRSETILSQNENYKTILIIIRRFW